MKKLDSDFRNAKEGDPVYHCSGLVGKVVRVDSSKDYPIRVRLGKYDSTYTLDGRYSLDTNQTIFTHPIAIIHADDLENFGGFKERVMEVSNDGLWFDRVVFGKVGGFFAAWNEAHTLENVDRKQVPSFWKFAREINHRAIEIKEQIAALQKELETLENEK
jgi:hypothetical protein